MTKYFCDSCEKEITKENKVDRELVNDRLVNRLSTTLCRNGHAIKIEVVTSMDGSVNSGLFCRHCVLEALLKLDDRPLRIGRVSDLTLGG